MHGKKYIGNRRKTAYSPRIRIPSERTREQKRSNTTSFDFMEDTPLGPEYATNASGAYGSGLAATGARRHGQKVASLVELLQELSMPQKGQSSTARGWTGAPSPAQMPASKVESARETTCAKGASDDRRQPSGWNKGAASRIERPEDAENNETPPLPSCSKPVPTPMRRAAGAPSTKSRRVAFVTQVDVRQENALDQQRHESIELSPRLPGPIRAVLGDCSSNHENGSRSGESTTRKTRKEDHFGNIPDNTSEQKGCEGTFAGSESRCCPTISPEVAGMDPAPEGTNSSQERSPRRRRLGGEHADNIRALELREDGNMNQWLTQVDSGTSGVCKQEDSAGDSARQKRQRSEYQDSAMQAIEENRGWKPTDRDKPDVVPVGLQRTAGIVLDGDAEPYDEELAEPSMDGPNPSQVVVSSRVRLCVNVLVTVKRCLRVECDQPEGNRSDITKELLEVRGLCRVRGVILALVEWKVVDADGMACQELSFMLSSTLKVDWPQQYIAYLEGKLVFRSEDGIDEGQQMECTLDTAERAETDVSMFAATGAC